MKKKRPPDRKDSPTRKEVKVLAQESLSSSVVNGIKGGIEPLSGGDNLTPNEISMLQLLTEGNEGANTSEESGVDSGVDEDDGKAHEEKVVCWLKEEDLTIVEHSLEVGLLKNKEGDFRSFLPGPSLGSGAFGNVNVIKVPPSDTEFAFKLFHPSTPAVNTKHELNVLRELAELKLPSDASDVESPYIAAGIYNYNGSLAGIITSRRLSSIYATVCQLVALNLTPTMLSRVINLWLANMVAITNEIERSLRFSIQDVDISAIVCRIGKSHSGDITVFSAYVDLGAWAYKCEIGEIGSCQEKYPVIPSERQREIGLSLDGSDKEPLQVWNTDSSLRALRVIIDNTGVKRTIREAYSSIVQHSLQVIFLQIRVALILMQKNSGLSVDSVKRATKGLLWDDHWCLKNWSTVESSGIEMTPKVVEIYGKMEALGKVIMPHFIRTFTTKGLASEAEPIADRYESSSLSC